MRIGYDGCSHLSGYENTGRHLKSSSAGCAGAGAEDGARAS